jgi:hypothetical protein
MYVCCDNRHRFITSASRPAHTTNMVACTDVPQKVWDEITLYLSPVFALYAAETFKFESRAFVKVWGAIFKSDQWHESPAAEHANIVLIGAGLGILGGTKTISTRPSVVLTAFDRAGDLQHEVDLLRSSFRRIYTGPGEYQLEHTYLLVGSFDVPIVIGRDFRYLFSVDKQYQTKYCY